MSEQRLQWHKLQQQMAALYAGQQTQTTLELSAPSSNKLAWFRVNMSILPSPSTGALPDDEVGQVPLLISIEKHHPAKLEQETMHTAAQAYQ